MPQFQKDYLERMIEQLAAALAAILKLRRSKKNDEALVLVRETSLSLFGMDYKTLTAVDPGSAAQLLGHPEKVKSLAKLVLEEVEILGNAPEAHDKLQLALSLLEESQRMNKGMDAQADEMILEVRRRLDAQL